MGMSAASAATFSMVPSKRLTTAAARNAVMRLMPSHSSRRRVEEKSRPARRLRSGQVGAEILQQVRHAAERTVGEAGRDRLAPVIVQLCHHGVDDGVALLHALDRGVQEVLGRHLATTDEIGQTQAVVPLELGKAPHRPTSAGAPRWRRDSWDRS